MEKCLLSSFLFKNIPAKVSRMEENNLDCKSSSRTDLFDSCHSRRSKPSPQLAILEILTQEKNPRPNHFHVDASWIKKT